MITENQSVNVLLVENDLVDAELNVLELRKAGFDVRSEVVQLPEEFQAKIQSGHYDVILADYNLTGWTGADAFEHLRREGPDVPFILVTGATGDETAAECIKRGIADYVLKDRLARLPIAVRQALEEKSLREDKARAEKTLWRLNEELEHRVIERTAQLEATNKELQIENIERRRVEKILRESQERFRLLVDGVKDYAIYMLDPQGRVASWNAGAERLKGYRAEEIIGRHYSCFYAREEAEGGKPERDVRVAATEGRLESERWAVRKDGSRFLANSVLTALGDHEGKLRGFSIVTRDVTDQRRAHEALEHLRLQQELILNSAGEGICGLDRWGSCTFINLAGAKMVGWEVKDLIGKSLHNILHHTKPDGASYPIEECLVHAALRIGKALQVDDEVFWRKDGTSFPVNYLVTPIRKNGGEIIGAVYVFHDVTEQRAVERMKDEFVSVVSHELRTPLTVIRAVLGILASGKLCQTPAECQRMVATGLANAERLQRLLNDILDLERYESGRVMMEKRACDTTQLVEQARDLMRIAAEARGVTLSASLRPASVWADPDRILQVLINLLSNAIKFSPRGAVVHLSADRKGAEILFQVRDEGRGIPASKLSCIFERFQQVDTSDSREKGGTGLGLAICRSIVAQHGGRIWVESVLDHGSVFFFTLPAQGAGPASPGEGSQKCLEES